MAKRKFKIGDRVTVTDKSDRPYGMTGIIVDYRGGEALIQFKNWHGGHNGGTLKRPRDEDDCWYVKENYLRLATETIVIYRNGNVVTALDKSTGKKAEARCNPADEFDFHVGAKLAFERLTDKTVKVKGIAVGDKIIVVAPLETYSSYGNWTGLRDYKDNFVLLRIPVRDKEYVVRRIAEHDTYGNMLALIQDSDTTQVFIISIDGIKKAN